MNDCMLSKLSFPLPCYPLSFSLMGSYNEHMWECEAQGVIEQGNDKLQKKLCIKSGWGEFGGEEKQKVLTIYVSSCITYCNFSHTIL